MDLISHVITRQITSGSDQDLNKAFHLYRRKFTARVRTDEADIRDWIEHSEAKWHRPTIYVIATRGDQVVGILHYTFDRTLGYGLVSYIASEDGGFYPLLRYLRQDLRTRGCRGVFFEVDKLVPGLDPDEYVRRKERLEKFQREGARVVQGLRYLQPALQPWQRGSEEEMHLMYAPLNGIVTQLTRKEVGEILDFIYGRWYRDPYSADPGYVAYLQKLQRRMTRWLPRRFPVRKLGFHDYPGKPPSAKKWVMLNSVVLAVGTAYRFVPFQNVLNGWARVVMAQVGEALVLGGCVLALAGLNLWLKKNGREFDE